MSVRGKLTCKAPLAGVARVEDGGDNDEDGDHGEYDASDATSVDSAG